MQDKAKKKCRSSSKKKNANHQSEKIQVIATRNESHQQKTILHEKSFNCKKKASYRPKTAINSPKNISQKNASHNPQNARQSKKKKCRLSSKKKKKKMQIISQKKFKSLPQEMKAINKKQFCTRSHFIPKKNVSYRPKIAINRPKKYKPTSKKCQS